MKLYRHYKQKHYTYIGIAKHSETLEDMVVYNCRYPNELGKMWVRPRENFEGLMNGKPRFEKIEARIEIIRDFKDREIELVKEVNEKIFADWDQRYFLEGFESRNEHVLLAAFIDDKLVGYKLGYPSAHDKDAFYSWLGGVDPEFRGLGIAEDLMTLQHDWLRTQGYKKVQTKTMNKFPAMLILNIKSGFQIVKSETDLKNRFMIYLEKIL